MASIRPCNKCGERISIRQMPHGQWVAFDVATDNQHECSRKRLKNKDSKKKKYSNKDTDYGGIRFEDSDIVNNEIDDIKDDDYQDEIEEIQRLKNHDNYKKNISKNKDSEFPTYIVIAVLVSIFLIIFVIP